MSKSDRPACAKRLYFPGHRRPPLQPHVCSHSHSVSADAGKPPMLIIGAAMRKLIHFAFGVLKSGRAYDAHLAQA